jgi:hypothetical protein
LAEGEDFYVYLSLSDGGHPYDRTSDIPVLLGASYRTIVESSSNPEESYYKSGTDWLDFYDYNDPSGFQNTGNFCIKALSTDGSTGINPPQNLQAEVIDINSVSLTWSPGDRELLSYKVYRDSELIAEVSNTPVPTTYYVDEALDAGEYSYYVIAVYDEGESDPSEEVTAEIILYPPANLSAESQGYNIVLMWDAPCREFVHYCIYKNDELLTTTTAVFHVDVNVPSGYYEYYVTAVYSGDYESEPSNTATIQHTDTENNLLPTRTELKSNFPNPFNPQTTISFNLKETANVGITIFNVKGEKIRTLIDGEKDAGSYYVIWNGMDKADNIVPSGIYFYKMVSEGDSGRYTSTKKMILLK